MMNPCSVKIIGLIYATYLILSLGQSGCSRRPPRPSFVAKSQEEIVEKLRDLGADIKTDDEGLVSDVSFYYDPDTYRPRVGNDEIKCLNGLRSLKRLSLMWTSVNDEGLVEISKCKNLDELALSFGGGISNDGLAHLSELTQLSSLMVGWNEIDDQGIKHLRKLKNLRSLGLDKTLVTALSLPQLGCKAVLEELYLQESRITDNSIVVLNQFPALRVLDLSNNRLSNEGLMEIVPILRNLQYLDLSATEISDELIATLGETDGLEQLNLSGTKITDQSLKAISTCPNIEVLKVSQTSISDRGISYFESMNFPKRIYLYDTAVTEKACERLRKIGCEVWQ